MSTDLQRLRDSRVPSLPKLMAVEAVVFMAAAALTVRLLVPLDATAGGRLKGSGADSVVLVPGGGLLPGDVHGRRIGSKKKKGRAAGQPKI